MKKKRVSRSKQVRQQNRVAMVCISLIVIVLLGAIMLSSHQLQNTIEVNNASIEALDDQIRDEEQRAQDIEDEEDYMKSDEYVEKIAHEKIGLIYDNEIIFKENN